MTALTDNMTFGTFMAPFHRVGENPTLALERDLELIEWLDDLGFDEAWIGEHHSGGWETIASPEVFIATAAGRTRHIRLGTGVVSLPYHHPYMVANRMVLLDHLTRGRVMLGVGPGALASDANMFCIDPERQREMMDESLGVIMQLLDGSEPVTCDTDWFKLKDATLQLRPYQKPTLPVAVASLQSPARSAFGGQTRSLGDLTQRASRYRQKHFLERPVGHRTVRREDWRLSVGCHLAETREQAFEDIRVGAGRVVTEYTGGTNGNPIPDVPANEVVDYMVEHNQWIVGTPDDCIAGIERLQEASGGFGGLGTPRQIAPKLRIDGSLCHAAVSRQPHGNHRHPAEVRQHEGSTPSEQEGWLEAGYRFLRGRESLILGQPARTYLLVNQNNWRRV